MLSIRLRPGLGSSQSQIVWLPSLNAESLEHLSSPQHNRNTFDFRSGSDSNVWTGSAICCRTNDINASTDLYKQTQGFNNHKHPHWLCHSAAGKRWDKKSTYRGDHAMSRWESDVWLQKLIVQCCKDSTNDVWDYLTKAVSHVENVNTQILTQTEQVSSHGWCFWGGRGREGLFVKATNECSQNPMMERWIDTGRQEEGQTGRWRHEPTHG